MHVRIGSNNPVKINAVRDTLAGYDSFAKAQVLGVAVQSEVDEQPLSLEVTVQGACNRAHNAYQPESIGVGVEDGLMPVPNTQSGYMNICVVVLYDGKQDYLGLSPGFEYPPQVIEKVIEEGMDISQAFHAVGLTEKANVGVAEGAIGILSGGRIDRKNYIVPAIHMAMTAYNQKFQKHE